MSAAPLEFWFEFASTYSYPAALRVEAAARDAGVPLAWRPFLLGPIFRAQGWNDSPFNIYPAKGRYMWRDLERICTELGVALRKPSAFPRNGLLAARVACRFADEAWCADFVRAVFRANFAEDREIADAEVVASCLDGAGQPARDRIEAALAPESKELLRAQSERAVALGIIGAPTFAVGAELFWGNDRLETALAWWQRARDSLARAAAP
jgi:2-hydroxychromene-2-carboxylate isomerase